MDWTQTLTIIATVTTATVGCVIYVHATINREISIMRDNMNRIEDRWNKTDEKWERLFEKMDSKLEKMDSKWERLFEKVLVVNK